MEPIELLERIEKEVLKLREEFDNCKKTTRKEDVCLCGCGGKLLHPETGRRKKYASDACRKRYERRNHKLLALEKKMRSKPIKQIRQGAV